MCHYTPCGNCIVHDGPYSDVNSWGQIDTSTTSRRFGGGLGTATATSRTRTPIQCHNCNTIFHPVSREWC
ncbi:hypothetical protein LCGC14_1620440 [marine sediment metagenome]|uniref:Uncharacterized protein n=1 Tax=marine sediment metagenome TaxID=412755 RepID=A0A0F9I5U5_9ZZZZ|nr:hypothetical protein [bacterium]